MNSHVRVRILKNLKKIYFVFFFHSMHWQTQTHHTDVIESKRNKILRIGL